MGSINRYLVYNGFRKNGVATKRNPVPHVKFEIREISREMVARGKKSAKPELEIDAGVSSLAAEWQVPEPSSLSLLTVGAAPSSEGTRGEQPKCADTGQGQDMRASPSALHAHGVATKV